MKISEAIAQATRFRPGCAYSSDDMICWLSEVDGYIKREIIDAHEGSEAVRFTPYTPDTPQDTELLTPEPYSALYRHYLIAQIDLANAETEKYNNSIGDYNTSLRAFSDYFTRTHTPRQCAARYF